MEAHDPADEGGGADAVSLRCSTFHMAGFLMLEKHGDVVP